MRTHIATASFVAALVFAAAGMWLPPKGEIDGSVLILVAQLLVLTATFLGIKGYSNIIESKHQKP